MSRPQTYAEAGLWAIYSVIVILTICLFDGTGDSGDSIQHYLFAKYAPQHPALYFDHWAKPVFVLLASPFAQFGFVGMKVFNALVSGFVLLFTYRCAKKLGYTYALLAAVFVLGMPLYYILTFSGLTEPLFALFLVISLYMCLNGHYKAAAVLLSFLPFVRSEGLILMGIFGVYFLYRKQFMPILLLTVGHVLYSIAGYFVYNDLFWVIAKIPYARMDAYSGTGRLMHFVEQLYYVIGLPIYVLLGLGILSLALPLIRPKKYNARPEEILLMASGFLAFLTAHTLFWYWGIFHSMGLKRVLLSVAPLMALLALRGLHVALNALPASLPKLKPILVSVVIVPVLVLPFTKHPTGILFRETMRLSEDQYQAREMAATVARLPRQPKTYLFTHPYLAEAIHIDPFNREVCKPLTPRNLRQTQPGDVVIWDRHFAVLEQGISEKEFIRHPHLKEIHRLYASQDGGVTFIVYQAVY